MADKRGYRRISLAIGDPDSKLECPPEAQQFITFTTGRKYADAIYKMVKAFKE